MACLESRLRSLHQFKSSPNHPSKRTGEAAEQEEPLFLVDANRDGSSVEWLGEFIDDDHIPFLRRGVDVLYLMPRSLPSVWHEIEDDGEHLDMDIVEDWTKLVMSFVAEWMGLEGHL